VIDLIAYLIVALAILGVGIRVGMLIAARLGRWTDRDEEPDGR
jgi:F0F1-type ATP synthase membrane subunit c/vacuolar-type H+-ATPase subunit K